MIRGSTWRIRAVAALAAGVAIAAAISTAGAAIVTIAPDTNFSTMPASINLGTGTYVFSDIPGVPIGNPPAAVATIGSALVSSFGSGVADSGPGSTINETGELYTFASFPTATVIPNSAADDFIGLAFSQSDGLHFGYARVAGTTLISYAYQTVPGVGIRTSIPEPGALLLLGTSLIGVASVRRRRSKRGAPGEQRPMTSVTG